MRSTFADGSLTKEIYFNRREGTRARFYSCSSHHRKVKFINKIRNQRETLYTANGQARYYSDFAERMHRLFPE